jgi:hypothetical protein
MPIAHTYSKHIWRYCFISVLHSCVLIVLKLLFYPVLKSPSNMFLCFLLLFVAIIQFICIITFIVCPFHTSPIDVILVSDPPFINILNISIEIVIYQCSLASLLFLIIILLINLFKNRKLKQINKNGRRRKNCTLGISRR